MMPLLLLVSLLAGCNAPPPDAATACCITPAPGTVTVHNDMDVLGDVAVWHRQ
jgi:hypothetical protein